jgi:hypothetical protein
VTEGWTERPPIIRAISSRWVSPGPCCGVEGPAVNATCQEQSIPSFDQTLIWTEASDSLPVVPRWLKPAHAVASVWLNPTEAAHVQGTSKYDKMLPIYGLNSSLVAVKT